MSTFHRAALLAAAPSILAALPPSASADVVQAIYNNPDSYSYKLKYMPDFDQRRSQCCITPGLPGEGSMYCVPTSTMDVFAYAANHGFPNFPPGTGVWQSNTRYDDATAGIDLLGTTYMHTQAVNGTDGVGWSTGSQAWLTVFNAGYLTRTMFYFDGNNSVSVADMAAAGVGGGVMAFAYGRWQVVGSYAGLPLLSRTGGHCIGFVGAHADQSGGTIRYRDPADDPANTSQSWFATGQATVTHVLVALDTSPSWIRTVDALNYPCGDGLYRFVDAYLLLKPIDVLSFQNSGGQYEMITYSPLSFDGLAAATATLGTLGGVSDIAHELTPTALVLERIPGPFATTSLKRVNLATSAVTTVGTMSTLKRFTTGRDGSIYAHDGATLYCMRPDGTVTASNPTVPMPTALAYDDASDQVILLSVPQRKVNRYSKTLMLISSFDIPSTFPMSGDGTIDVNPIDGKTYFVTDASSMIGRITPTSIVYSFSAFTVPGLSLPKGIGAVDDGSLLVPTMDGLRHLRPTTSGGWMIDMMSPFHNLPVTSRMSHRRSRSNVDPALHATPGWVNLPADELFPIGVAVSDCLADLNNDNTVDGADLGMLLAAWGTGSTSADLNGDGTVDGADLGLLLAEWGPCP